MKKFALLTIISGLLFTLNISAQVKLPAQKNELTKSQKMMPFAMGMAVEVLSLRYDQNHYDSVVDFQTSIRYFSAELKPLVDLKNDKNEMLRAEIAAKTIKALEAKMNDSDKWKFRAGKLFGDLFAEIKNADDKGEKVDNGAMGVYLNGITHYCDNAPKDVPWNVTAKMREVGKLAELEDFSNDKNIKAVANKVIETLNEIMSEK
jgi:hypothetical protein